MLEKLKKNLDKSIMTVGVQSSTYLEVNKCKIKIENTNVEINKKLFALGEAVFAQWKEAGIDAEQITDLCKPIADLEQDLKNYQAEIERLEAEKDRLLSGGISSVSTDATILCVCGYRNSSEAKFCSGCGRLVVHPEETKSPKCSSCGSILEEDSRFCSNCGAVQEKEKE